jgi:hypothetical protein
MMTWCIVMLLLHGSAGASPSHSAVSTSKPKVLNLEKLNTAADEDGPCLSPDGQQLFYVTKEKETWVLKQATRASTNSPLSPVRECDELMGEGSVITPYLLPKDKDGWEYLYFSSQYHTDKKKPNFDLYRVGRFNPARPFQGFIAASPLQNVASEADEVAPWVSADAKDLYFSRKTAEGWKLFQSKATMPHAFEKPVEAGLAVGFHHAVLNRSGLTMIVQGPVENRQGLFVSKRTSKDATWSDPVPLTSLNGDAGDTISPALSSDTRYLYFASNRAGGKGGYDLYVVAVSEVEELKR